jgi:hypothetical protein
MTDVPNPLSGLLNTRQAAAFLNLHPKTLVMWRGKGCGPRYIHVGERAIRYRLSDLDEFVQASNREVTL